VWSGDALAHFATVKRAFDPDDLFNPGAKIATPGEHAVEQVKYDPALPELPGSARQALSIVERDRAYARSRLELLAAHAAGPARAEPDEDAGAPLD
jgi:hypothetical protein